MCMNCEPFLPECQAECCGPCPIPKALWAASQDKLQRVPTTALDDGDGFVHQMGADGNCCFKQADFRCAIYDRRPEVCHLFGDESHPLLRCRWQKKDGRRRSRTERRQLSRELMEDQDRFLAGLRQKAL